MPNFSKQLRKTDVFYFSLSTNDKDLRLFKYYCKAQIMEISIKRLLMKMNIVIELSVIGALPWCFKRRASPPLGLEELKVVAEKQGMFVEY